MKYILIAIMMLAVFRLGWRMREYEFSPRRGEQHHQYTPPPPENLTTDQHAENYAVEMFYGDPQEQKDYVEIWSGYPLEGMS